MFIVDIDHEYPLRHTSSLSTAGLNLIVSEHTLVYT